VRAIKRQTLPLNQNKKEAVEKLCSAYSKEKRYWLNRLSSAENQSRLGKGRLIRDEAITQGYQSRFGLQARHWKLALQDAIETWDKYWQAIFSSVRFRIRRKEMTETERHYAFWLLTDYDRFAAVMKGQAPLPSFEIDPKTCRKIASYVQRSIKRCKGRSPTVKKAQTIKFDANCYEVFEEKGTQYIKLMSQEKGKRLVIPLMGHTKIRGNLTLVMKEEVYIHFSQELKTRDQTNDQMEAVDFGYTEVMTDTKGNRYGKGLGKSLDEATEKRHVKMQKRHKLHSMGKRLKEKNPGRAKRIKIYNLGNKKRKAQTKRVREDLSREINQAINDLIKTRAPSIVITENLRTPFHYSHSKKVNRRLSVWVRGEIQDRIAFKALAKGFRHSEVNPAYGSQTCPNCDFVDQGNRKADVFKCLNCKHEDQADRVAALNYARRYGDPEIELYMPYNQVKTILLERFHRRLETGQPVTVPGRTLETVLEGNPQSSIEAIGLL
jgi:IS605 OrfB family transposase